MTAVHRAMAHVDRTEEFNTLLRERRAPATRRAVPLATIEGFLKEAYRINHHITSLHRELKEVRQAYLSTSQHRRPHGSGAQPRVLSDREREEVDANAKQMVRELNAGIRGLEEAEQLRRETESAVLRKKYVGGLGALGAWAAGEGRGAKTAEHAQAEAATQQVSIHRDSVVWFLRQGLEACCRTQQEMMESRLAREVEKSRGLLAPAMQDFAQFQPKGESARGDETAGKAGQDLTQEQMQMFEEGSQEMLKHYESTLNKVRTAEKSLLEISELQSLLVNNLAVQSAHIEQLVSDSFSTTENVGGGNKELKKATQRASTARYTFFAASGLCAFLIVWDLVI